MHLALFQFYFNHRNNTLEILEDTEGELKLDYSCSYRVLCYVCYSKAVRFLFHLNQNI